MSELTDKPKVIFCDIDGTLTEHMTPFDAMNPEAVMKPLHGTINKLLEWDRERIK